MKFGVFYGWNRKWPETLGLNKGDEIIMSDESFKSASEVVRLYEEGKLGISPRPGFIKEVNDAFDEFVERVRHERALQSMVDQSNKDRAKDPLG